MPLPPPPPPPPFKPMHGGFLPMTNPFGFSMDQPSMSAPAVQQTDHVMLQMQISQIQARLVGLHRTMDALVTSMSDLTSLMHRHLQSHPPEPVVPVVVAASVPAAAADVAPEACEAVALSSVLDVDHRRRTVM